MLRTGRSPTTHARAREPIGRRPQAFRYLKLARSTSNRNFFRLFYAGARNSTVTYCSVPRFGREDSGHGKSMTFLARTYAQIFFFLKQSRTSAIAVNASPSVRRVLLRRRVIPGMTSDNIPLNEQYPSALCTSVWKKCPIEFEYLKRDVHVYSNCA